MATNQNETIIRRFFDEICNQRNLALADELFSANHAYHDPQIPAEPGPEGIRQVISTYQTAFPDAHWHVEEMFAAGDVIVTRWKGTGTHKKELNGIPPTGKYVHVDGIWIHRLKDGKVVESWNVWDTLGLMQKLGVVPTTAEAASV